MAMATNKSMPMPISMPATPISSPPSSSSSSHRNLKSTQPFSASATTSGTTEESRFKFSKLLHLHSHSHHQYQRHEHSQRQLDQQRRQHHSGFSSKHSSGTRFRDRIHQRGGFFGFLQSHYHALHRHQEERPSRDEVSKERELRSTNEAGSPLSPVSSFMSSIHSGKSPYTTVHSGYNVTISDFRAHSTIGSIRSGTTPTKVTDVVFERRAFEPHATPSRRGEDNVAKTTILTSASTPTTASTAHVSMTPNVGTGSDISSSMAHGRGHGFRASLRSLGMISLVASPSSLPSSPQPTVLASPVVLPDSQEGSSTKSASKGWSAGARKMGFLGLKKKRSMPNHYMSLPVGGSTSSGTNGMYMLHSEDLSVTEFAKLAGITILPEVDPPLFSGLRDEHLITASTAESIHVGAHGRAGTGAGSAGNTLHSERSLTCGSMASNNSLRRANIWDAQFWTAPYKETGLQPALPVSSSSLPTLSALPPTPMTDHLLPQPATSLDTPRRLSLQPNMSSSAPTRASSTNALLRSGSSSGDGANSSTRVHPPRNSCSPLGVWSGSAPGATETPEGVCVRPASGAPLKRVDQLAKLPKEAIQLSQNLSRRQSFSSLTALALELDGEHEQEVDGESGATKDSTEERRGSGDHAARQHTPMFDPATAPGQSRVLLDASKPIRPALSSLPHHPSPHVLQGSKIKVHLGGHSGLHSGLGSRARSPSPSPLSRQIDDADADTGRESGQEDIQCHPPPSRNPAKSYVHESGRKESLTLTPVPSPATMEAPGSLHFSPMIHNRTLSMPPSLLSAPATETQPPPRTPPQRPQTPQSSTGRSFTPGTKVGRFTLVQELCTKHVDVLKAQQSGSPSSETGRHGSLVNGQSVVMNGASSSGQGEGAAGVPMEMMNPMLMPEENVLVFQRKRARRVASNQPLLERPPPPPLPPASL